MKVKERAKGSLSDVYWQLCDDVLGIVFSFLPLKQLSNLRVLSKRCRYLLQERVLWRLKFDFENIHTCDIQIPGNLCNNYRKEIVNYVHVSYKRAKSLFFDFPCTTRYYHDYRDSESGTMFQRRENSILYLLLYQLDYMWNDTVEEISINEVHKRLEKNLVDFRKFKKLQRLCLSYSSDPSESPWLRKVGQLSSGDILCDDRFHPLGNMFTSRIMGNFRELDLGKSTINSVAGFANLKHLEKLTLRECLIVVPFENFMYAPLDVCKSIQDLSLYKCSYESKGFFPFVSVWVPNLQFLEIQGDRCSSNLDFYLERTISDEYEERMKRMRKWCSEMKCLTTIVLYSYAFHLAYDRKEMRVKHFSEYEEACGIYPDYSIPDCIRKNYELSDFIFKSPNLKTCVVPFLDFTSPISSRIIDRENFRCGETINMQSFSNLSVVDLRICSDSEIWPVKKLESVENKLIMKSTYFLKENDLSRWFVVVFGYCVKVKDVRIYCPSMSQSWNKLPDLKYGCTTRNLVSLEINRMLTKCDVLETIINTSKKLEKVKLWDVMFAEEEVIKCVISSSSLRYFKMIESNIEIVVFDTPSIQKIRLQSVLGLIDLGVDRPASLKELYVDHPSYQFRFPEKLIEDISIWRGPCAILKHKTGDRYDKDDSIEKYYNRFKNLNSRKVVNEVDISYSLETNWNLNYFEMSVIHFRRENPCNYNCYAWILDESERSFN